MVNITVKNYRGIERADLAVHSITLIGALNYQGKTSICEAVGAALSRQRIPKIKEGSDLTTFKPQINIGDAKMLVKGTAKKGDVYIKGETGGIRVTWPDAEVVEEGKDAPRASVFAAGLMTTVQLSDKARSSFFYNLLKVTPVRADFDTALKDDEIPKDYADKVWSGIEKQGWDGAWEKMKEHGTKMKRGWEEAAGERYGKDKAVGWIPDGWDPALEDVEIEDLEAKVEEARQAHDDARANMAVSNATIAQLDDARKQKKPDLVAIQKTLDKANLAMSDAVKARDALPPVDPFTQALECPHCQGHVVAQMGKLVKAEKLTSEETAKRKKAIEAAHSTVAKCKGVVDQEAAALQQGIAKIAEIERAEKAWKEGQDRAGTPDASAAASEALEAATRQLSLKRAKVNATRAAEAAELADKVAKALAPDGIRLTVLKRVVTAFNKDLKGLCDAAGWPIVMLNDDMEPLLLGRPYILLSESEQKIVDVILQVAIAKRDGSEMVVIDRVDVFTQGGRNALFQLLMATEVPCLMAMSVSKLEALPDLGKMEEPAGAMSYWCEAGILSPVGGEA